jgi:hypothetical protein
MLSNSIIYLSAELHRNETISTPSQNKVAPLVAPTIKCCPS